MIAPRDTPRLTAHHPPTGSLVRASRVGPTTSDSVVAFTTQVHSYPALEGRFPAWTALVHHARAEVPLSQHPRWLSILHAALGHTVYAVETTSATGQTLGFLPLAFVESLLFGRFLVSLPYLNTNGVVAAFPEVQQQLVTRAATLAEELNVQYLELRHEVPVAHPALTVEYTEKVHLRLRLPASGEQLWKAFDPKVRNQIRKAEKAALTIHWGTQELLDDFYTVLARNMRDLGSPVYGKPLFAAILATFPNQAEIVVLRDGRQPVAAALLLHGQGRTEVPTASSLKDYNPSCANMLMYHHLLRRAVERGQQVFDFGRSTRGSNTFRFKKQWGAEPHPATWQYHLVAGSHAGQMRPENPRYQWAIRLWQRLPVWLTRQLGPRIVRGIP
ncbi:MAG: FemAB family PEP-CTERM system-associated protein [Gemmataceae bacterium]|nr:FemAB family PEP-CTERM system-associated protein [Gemmata sp.]MDW8199431.1 FemAB family PEP-CTERM system-associated protein [Gemmataceae bacterium]